MGPGGRGGRGGFGNRDWQDRGRDGQSQQKAGERCVFACFLYAQTSVCVHVRVRDVWFTVRLCVQSGCSVWICLRVFVPSDNS